MKQLILKKSQIWGLITFTWEMKLLLKSINNPLYRPLVFIIGIINNFQMFIDKKLRKHLTCIK